MLLIIMCEHRHLSITVIRVFLQNGFIDCQCLLLLTVYIKRVPVQTAVVIIIRILVCELLHLSNRSFLVTFLCIERTLGKRQAFTLTLGNFQSVQRTYRVIIVLLLFVELYQDAQDIVTAMVLVIQLLHHVDAFSILPLTDINTP